MQVKSLPESHDQRGRLNITGQDAQLFAVAGGAANGNGKDFPLTSVMQVTRHTVIRPGETDMGREGSGREKGEGKGSRKQHLTSHSHTFVPCVQVVQLCMCVYM